MRFHKGDAIRRSVVMMKVRVIDPRYGAITMLAFLFAVGKTVNSTIGDNFHSNVFLKK